MSSRVASAAFLIGVGNVVSRLLGLVREQVIAALFGATGPTSAFRTATRVSTAAYDLLLAGAITAAFVPVFTEYGSPARKRDLSRVVSTFVNLILVGIGGFIAVLVIGAPWIVSILGADPEHFDLAVDLTRLALPSVVFLGLAGILTAVLQARQAFLAPAFATSAYNVGIIVAALALAGALGIQALALGLLVGAGLQALCQLSAWRGLRYLPVIDLNDPGVRKTIRLYTPVFLGMIVSYFAVIIDTNLAWRTGEDSVAAMGFATTLIQFPIGMVGAAASLAILPSLSELASAEQEREAFFALLVRGLKAVLLIITPLFVALVLLRQPLVAVLFERAAFDSVATQRTSLALLAYSPQLPFVVVDQLLIVAFYAQRRTVTPVIVGVGGVGVYLAVAMSAIGPLGMPGLALANAIQNSAHAVVLYILLARSHAALRDVAALRFGLRVAIAGAAAAAAILVTDAWIGPLLTDASLPLRLAGLAAAGAAALLAYGAALVLLRVQEVLDIRDLVLRSLPPFPLDGGGQGRG